MNNIAAVILAAGASTRFGRPKQLLDWGKTPLLVHVAGVALSAGFAPVVVVLGCRAEAIRAALEPLARPAQIVMNWRWQQGMSTSVQTGLAALPPTTEAVIFLQCDQPLVTADLLRAMAARFKETDALIVHPTHAGQRSTPVLFARRLFPELAAVTGDEGGRSLIAQYAKSAAAIEVADPDVLADVDTPADYERLAHQLAQKAPSPQPKLESIRHLIVDMDGVLWRGDESMPGLQQFFEFLRQHDVGFCLATNNASRLPEQYAAKLARFGVEIPVESILSAAQAAAAYLAGIAPPGTHVYAIGREGTRQALEEHGFVLIDEGAGYVGAEYVVSGWDRDLTWEKLKTAALLIHEGASFIGTNPDTSFPTERGPVPGNGAQLAALQATTGVAPTVIGKPEPWMYEEAMRRMNARPETTAVIGDRLDTDIEGGVRAGITTILTLSGITAEADLAASPIKPDLIVADITELIQTWKNQLSRREEQK